MQNYKRIILLINKLFKYSYFIIFAFFLLLFIKSNYLKPIIDFTITRILSSTLLQLDIKPFFISGVSKTGGKFNLTSKDLENYIANYLFDEDIVLKDPRMSFLLSGDQELNINSLIGRIDNNTKIFYAENKVNVSIKDQFVVETEAFSFDLNKYDFETSEGVNLKNDLINIDFNQIKSNDLFKTVLLIGDFDGIINNTKDSQNNYSISIEGDVFYNLQSKDIYIENEVIIFNQYDKLQFNYFKGKIKNFSGKFFDTIFYSFTFNDIYYENNLTATVFQAPIAIFNDRKNVLSFLPASSDKVSYVSKNLDIDFKKGFQYQLQDSILVTTSGSTIYGKQEDGNISYTLISDLLYTKISENYELQYAEIFDNIKLISEDFFVSSDYGYINFEDNYILLEDNVSISSQESNFYPCRVVILLDTGDIDFIRCDEDRQFNIDIKRVRK